ncbi:rhomboid family intramembrane serine protease GlpG [Vibrio sp. CAIM 722]|uniref:Rhomboid family intramembrane serine protease GlpG n=1 Tax=Vibrio eleionomae TaxID=2653505 RepID=A0A7X4RVF1_9VIBR|nr:rhomboid family intramembrane serine protease GlpG [Vibrio eleionomae]MZI94478.1 rhomboid family intramembrane serine protease GlpG [Vibrio eleionomae]
MIKLVTLNNPRVAQAFIDYMAKQQIDIQIMSEGDGQFSLWLSDDSQYSAVVDELNLFITHPDDPKYQAASWEIGHDQSPPFKYQSPSLISMIKDRAGPVTLIIMVACIAIYLLQILGFGRAIFSLLHFPAYTSQQWQLWRWVSHALLHFSVMHIAFNLLWWWDLGGSIEKKLGSVTVAKIFVVSAVISGAGQYWVDGANFGGLSGVVYALLGYIWVISVRAPHLGVSLPKSIVIFMLIWLVLGYVQPFMAIANTAHLAGLLAGGLLGLSDAWRHQAK